MSATLRRDDAAGVINRIMKEQHLSKNDIETSKAKRGSKTQGPYSPTQIVYGIGQFNCEKCNRSWMSNFSWMRINLLDQRIEYKWSMKCKSCLIPYEPTFSIEEFEILILKAICLYKGKDYFEEFVKPRGVGSGEGRRRHNPTRRRKDPHLNYLCEKCEYGLTQCWLYRS